MSDNKVIKSYIYNRVLGKNRELKSKLFQIDEKISEARAREEYLKNMWWLVGAEQMAKPGFRFPLDKSYEKDTYQLFGENESLKDDLAKKQAKLEEIEKHNNRLEAEIYGMGHEY